MMKRLSLMFLVAFFAAGPAHAMRITNLDHVPHVIAHEVSGTTSKRTLAPNETIYFTGYTEGNLSLLSGPADEDPDARLHTDGILRGIVGAARTQDIPTVDSARYVIWPGGQLSLQSHMRIRRGR